MKAIEIVAILLAIPWAVLGLVAGYYCINLLITTNKDKNNG